MRYQPRALGVIGAQASDPYVDSLHGFGRHWLFVRRLVPDEVTSWLRGRIESLHGDTYNDVAQKIARIGLWELE
jgi:hypothetical protein